jgi:hypothetical protein
LKRIKKPLVVAFLIWHLSALFVCAWPGSSALRNHLGVVFRPYFGFFHLWQNWSMFAPEPSSLNAFVRVEVKYKDGKVRWFDLPRMSELGYVDKYFQERYRKWAVDNIRSDDSRGYWPAAARYLARKANPDPLNPPVEISLWRFWMTIESPDVKFRPVGFRVSEQELQKFKFFTTALKPEDLI